VALISGKHIFGEFGGRIVGALICIGLVSSISAMTWIGPRVTMAMGKDHALLRRLSFTTREGVPTAATLLQLAIVSVLLMTQSFEAVLDTIQFSLTLCSFLAVLGVVVLRWQAPDLPRPYRTWGYPLTPLVFLGVTAFMMFHLIVERPQQSLAGLVIMLAGLAVYAYSQSRPSDVRQFDRKTHG
jgi:APA family basic amino acid/polyamine antiporter